MWNFKMRYAGVVRWHTKGEIFSTSKLLHAFINIRQDEKSLFPCRHHSKEECERRMEEKSSSLWRCTDQILSSFIHFRYLRLFSLFPSCHFSGPVRTRSHIKKAIVAQRETVATTNITFMIVDWIWSLLDLHTKNEPNLEPQVQQWIYTFLGVR